MAYPQILSDIRTRKWPTGFSARTCSASCLDIIPGNSFQAFSVVSGTATRGRSRALPWNHGAIWFFSSMAALLSYSDVLNHSVIASRLLGLTLPTAIEDGSFALLEGTGGLDQRLSQGPTHLRSRVTFSPAGRHRRRRGPPGRSRTSSYVPPALFELSPGSAAPLLWPFSLQQETV